MEVPQVVAARRSYPFVPDLYPSSPELTTPQSGSGGSPHALACPVRLRAAADRGIRRRVEDPRATRRRSAASASLFPAGCEPTIGSSLVSLKVASPARRLIQPCGLRRHCSKAWGDGLEGEGAGACPRGCRSTRRSNSLSRSLLHRVSKGTARRCGLIRSFGAFDADGRVYGSELVAIIVLDISAPDHQGALSVPLAVQLRSPPVVMRAGWC